MKLKRNRVCILTLIFLAITYTESKSLTPWCPSVTDYQINCSNCSIGLTCDVVGLPGLEIWGNNVYLDMGYHMVYYSPSQGGIMVYGANSSIEFGSVVSNDNNGIWYAGGATGNHLLNEMYIGTNNNTGVYSSSGTKLAAITIMHSDIDGNGLDGVYADMVSPSSTYGSIQFTSYSNITDNLGNGVYGYYGKNSIFNISTTSGNYGYGVFDYHGNTNSYYSSNFYSNLTGAGLELYSGTSYHVSDNNGGSNSGYDCYTNVPGQVSGSGNTWSNNYQCPN